MSLVESLDRKNRPIKHNMQYAPEKARCRSFHSIGSSRQEEPRWQIEQPIAVMVMDEREEAFRTKRRGLLKRVE